MTDALIAWNPALQAFDLALAGGDLALDGGLASLVLISLLEDRLADIDDTLPDGLPAGLGDRRGCWTDLPLSDAPSYATPNLRGSRLYLLSRAAQTTETLRRAEAYASEALAWMIEDGLVGSVTPVATYPQRGWMQLSTTVSQNGASSTYDLAWNLTSGAWVAGTIG